MKAYLIAVCCPACGGELDAVVSSKVCAGTECSAVSKCSRCSKEWLTQVTVRPVPTIAAERRAQHRARTRT